MRSPGVVYRKYRQMMRKMLYNKIANSYKKSHNNCKYGLLIDYLDVDNKKRTSKICLFSVENDLREKVDYRKLDICTCATECNAFAHKKTREQIIKEFEYDVEDFSICSKKYPDLALLKWVLDKDLEEAKKKPNLITKLIIKLINLLENLVKL